MNSFKVFYFSAILLAAIAAGHAAFFDLPSNGILGIVKDVKKGLVNKLLDNDKGENETKGDGSLLDKVSEGISDVLKGGGLLDKILKNRRNGNQNEAEGDDSLFEKLTAKIVKLVNNSIRKIMGNKKEKNQIEPKGDGSPRVEVRVGDASSELETDDTE